MTTIGIIELLQHINDLVSPSKEDKKNVNSLFDEKVANYGLNLEKLSKIDEAIEISSDLINESWWKYHNVVVEKLLTLKELLIEANEKDSLLSIAQQKSLKAAFEMVVVLGIVNHLPRGIGISLIQRSSFGNTILPSSTDEQKCHSLCLTVECLIRLRECEEYNKIIANRYTGDLLAGLFAVVLPSKVTALTMNVPHLFRNRAKKYLETMIDKGFQPTIVKELLLLHGNPDCPFGVARAYRGFLADRLMHKVGVVATIKAILDMTEGLSSPNHWKTVTTLATLIITPHVKDIEGYRSKVYPQILQLIYANEFEYSQIAVKCVRQLYEKDPYLCETWFLSKLTKPFQLPSSEDETDYAIEGLHNCCGIPCSENWALLTKAISSIHTDIFRLYIKTNSSIYRLKSKIKDLVETILKQCDPEEIYHRLLFDRGNIAFKFGESGGIATENIKDEEEEEEGWEMGPEMLLEILMSGPGLMKIKYFEVAISLIHSDNLDVKLTSAKFLSELATDEDVQREILQNPKTIINFVSELIKNEGQNAEIACVGLMVISALLNDPIHKSKRNWSAFKVLVDPLKEFQSKSQINLETRVLAEELRSMILSHGIISNKSDTVEKDVVNLNAAMEEAVSKHIPERAHGLTSLSKLIQTKDKQVWAKRDAIFCLFKENLKEEDSYVYLAAIKGLATLATVYPDEVLSTLIEQYRAGIDSPNRLKVGEILVNVVRHLNEMAAVYKGELIGAFLIGSQSDDPLIRASSLSNLGEVCKILGFRVHNYLTDVLELLGGILSTEKQAEPRRAAVMVVTLLLQGLGKDTFVTLQEQVITIYRTLKIISRNDSDDITKLHAEMAIKELNSITINFLMPPEKLEKRIFVLDPLPK